jgi:zinc D-Ala-D-Ala carboxypeptidase
MNEIIREPEKWHEDWCNFKPDELRCACCNRLEISSDLMDLLQKARNDLGSITITSGYRCPDYNSKVSKKTGLSGPHTTGYAVDIHISNSEHRKKILSYFADKVNGLGIAKTFIHIDLLNKDLGFDARPNCWLYS